MPGILPMKVIKIGPSSQARIAQACDRCRSKKIRCDGIRPSCTQCSNVGFECKTSDKLSRRAFPRGYTESLEERTRLLEAEVRELKELLDEKDEKIDMLSRMHSNSSTAYAGRRPSPIPDSPEVRDKSLEKDETFRVQQASLVPNNTGHDSYFEGGSGGRTLVEAFNRKAIKMGKLSTGVHSNVFFGTRAKAASSALSSPKRIVSFKAPPRLASDQMTNIFFQEWAPLFPVLHRPTFLSLYEEYVASPDTMVDKKSLAILNLVFGIAALSSNLRDDQDASSYEAQWQSAIESFLMDADIVTLQCFVLAQVFCLLKADYSRLLHYKGLAIGLSQRLGLHQSQKRFEHNALTSETRKKVFWSLYTVDCLSAAHLGLPRLVRDDDVDCEYPVDTDDEYVTEKGFQPTLPGESTKISSALALFRVSRILSKVLTELYPTSASYEISFQTIASLADELNDWEKNLAPHLKLTFAQDKPSTNVTSSRSPILSLAYHHIRSLIYRPAVIADLGDRSSSALVAVADSCKHIIQIVQLLDERGLCFSFCLSRNEVLVQAGFGLLLQTLTLARDGKLIKDCNRLVCAVIGMLEYAKAICSAEFRRTGCSVMIVPQPKEIAAPVLSRHSSDGNIRTPVDNFHATQRSLKAIAARFAPGITKSDQQLMKSPRRATLPVIPPSISTYTNPSSTSLSSIRSEPPAARSEPALSPLIPRKPLAAQNRYHPSSPTDLHRNIDYLSFSINTLPKLGSRLNPGTKSEYSPADWERFLSSLDGGTTNIYDTIYGGPPADGLLGVAPYPASTDSHTTWSPNGWSWEACGEQAPPPQSVLSFSDESLTSGEECGANPGEYDNTPEVEKTFISDYINSLIGTGGLDSNFGL